MTDSPTSTQRSLTPRFVGVCIVLALLSATAYIVLLVSIEDEHDESQIARDARERVGAADAVEEALATVGAKTSAYLLSRRTVFLSQRSDALASFADASTALTSVASTSPNGQASQAAAELVRAGERYIQDYSNVLVERASDPNATVAIADLTSEGEQRLAEIDAAFDAYSSDQRSVQLARQDRSDDATRRGLYAAAIGLIGSVLLIAGFTVFLVRQVLRPLRRAAQMANTLADGDLTVRMSEGGAGEIGALERSFNTMASSLESSRDQLLASADEQASLHRVAALAASGVPPNRLFDAVVEEVSRVFRASTTILIRYESDASAVVAASHAAPPGLSIGSQISLDRPPGGRVLTTGAPAVADERAGRFADRARSYGLTSAVSAPIVVEGHPWGAVILGWEAEREDLEALGERTQDFTELISSAIANADSMTKLTESRARLVTASDEARRRIERDLHDGTQQRLVSLALEYRVAISRIPERTNESTDELSRLTDELGSVVTELQELSRGIHPAILTQGGIVPALRALGRRSPLVVDVRAEGERRVREPVESTAYYVVSEALANVVKHAEADAVDVDIAFDDRSLHIRVHDDGRGGADPTLGSGILGLSDRAEAVGGRVEIVSPRGAGTTLSLWLPVSPPGGIAPEASARTS